MQFEFRSGGARHIQLVQKTVQIAPADPKVLGSLQLVAIPLGQGHPNQVAFKGPQGVVEGTAGQFVGSTQPPQLRGQVLNSQLQPAVRQHQAALDHVLQLAHVARPGVPRKGVQIAWGHAELLLLVGLGEGAQKEISQKWNVVGALAKRGHLDFYDGNTEIEVFAESAFADHLLQVAVGGADHANVHLAGKVRSQPLDFAFLQHAQQFGLQRKGEIADFIDKNRAPVRFLEASAAALVGAGKSPALVAEKFVVDERIGERAHRKRHKRLVGAGAQPMDGPGHDFLAGPTLAGYKHRG